MDFRAYQAFSSLFLLIFDCIKCLYYFLGGFSSVSSVFNFFLAEFSGSGDPKPGTGDRGPRTGDRRPGTGDRGPGAGRWEVIN